MANIDKINSVQVENIAKVKGRARNELRRSKGRPFGLGGPAPVSYPDLPSDGTVTVDPEGVMSFPDTFTDPVSLTIEEIHGEANPAFSDGIAYSFWYRWDGDTSSTAGLWLFQASGVASSRKSIGLQLLDNRLKVHRFTQNSIDLNVVQSDDFSSRGVDFHDGEWHHFYVSYQAGIYPGHHYTLAEDCTEYHIVVDGEHEFIGTALDISSSGAQPIQRPIGPTGINFGITSGIAFSLHAFEAIIDNPLTFEQVQWLYNNGSGRGTRTLALAVDQSTDDLTNSSLYLKTSLRSASGIDTSGLSSYEPFVIDGALEIHEGAFVPYQMFGFEQKAYSFWANITDSDKTVLDITMGTEANNSQWHQIHLSYTSADTLYLEYDRRIERSGSTNSFKGQNSSTTIYFDGSVSGQNSLIDDNFHHFLIIFDRNSDNTGTGLGQILVYVDGNHVGGTGFNRNPQQMQLPYKDDGNLFIDYEIEVSDVDIWFSNEFDSTNINTIYTGGPDLSAEPERNYWASLSGVGRRYGLSGLDAVLPSGVNSTNYGGGWSEDIAIPSLVSGESFTLSAVITGLGASDGWWLFIDPSVTSPNGNSFPVDSSGNFSWICGTTIQAKVNSTSNRRLQIKTTQSNTKTAHETYTSGTNISSSDPSNVGAELAHIKDVVWTFTKEAGGTWTIDLEVTSRYDNSVISLTYGTGFTLPSVMQVAVRGRINRDWNGTNVQVISFNPDPVV